MKLKDRMIKKLLSIGKKHRILVYPTLALVAIISAASHAICWGRGNGKKVVASVLVMALLVTQSIFLTSSADNDGVSGGENLTTTETETETKQINMNYILLGTDAATPIKSVQVSVDVTGNAENGYSTAQIPTPTADNLASILFGDDKRKDNFEFTEPYYIDKETNKNKKVENTVFKVNALNEAINIYLQATRTSYPAVIKAVDGVEGHDVELAPIAVTPESKTEGDISNPAVYTVLTAGDYTSGKYTNGAFRFGYKYNGLTYNGVGVAEGESIEIKPDGYVDKLELTPGWTPYEYKINYVAKKDDSVSWPEGLACPEAIALNQGAHNKAESADNVIYDQNYTLVGNDTIWAGNEAYVLDGWYDDATKEKYTGEVLGSKLALELGTVKADPNVQGKTLYAIWRYKDIILSSTGEKITINDNNEIKINATYGDNIDCTIFAEYKEDSSKGKNFKYKLGATSDEGAAALASLGLNGMEAIGTDKVHNGYKISGTLVDVTAEDGITIPLTVTDENKDDTKETTFYIKICVNKREVSIDPSSIKSNTDKNSAPYKPYDGTNLIGVNSRAEVFADSADLSGKLGNDDVYVNIKEPNAILDSADAGDSKKIILQDVELAGGKSDKYRLVGVEMTGDKANLSVADVARVGKKPLEIKIERIGDSDTDILFGQDTPQYRIYIKDASLLAATDAARYNSLEEGNDEQRTAFMRDVLGFDSWSTTRQLYSPSNTYSIEPNFDNNLSNYTVEKKGASASFNVVREDAQKDTDYKYSTEKAKNGFYPGLKITPYGKYDLIRLIEDGETDITEKMSKQAAVGMFHSEIKIDNCTDKPISFQLYDQDTGSITTIVNDTVSVDNSVPVYVSHSISADVKDKINNFKFGSYYHTQDNIETININFVYEAKFSECSKLCYYFVPDGSDTNGAEISVDMQQIPGTKTYSGTVKIGTANAGQLVVYAKNNTGGESARMKIKIDSAVEYHPADMDYYEWMIENKKIEAHNINVTDIYGDDITDTDKWYNGIKFSVPAEDEQSGVWKIKWEIKDEDGNLVDTDLAEIEALESAAAAVTDYGKIKSYTFKNSLTKEGIEAGRYTISAVVYDNAGNETQIDEIGPFLVDCNPPVITDATVPASGQYQSNVIFKFEVSDGENESGIDTVKLYDMNVSQPEGMLLNTWGVSDEYSQEITANGSYKVVATDKAGNIKEYTKVFTGISESVPNKPAIMISGTTGSNGWYYKGAVTIHIVTDTKTLDGVPIDTGYKLTFDDHYSTGVVPKAQAADYAIPVTEDGQVSIDVWATSEAGLTSGVVSQTIQVDTSAPDVIIEESSVDEDGIININYKITDAGSGVDKVYINGEPAEVKLEDGVATGSFKVTEDREYIISAVDIAGNESGDKGFAPLMLKAGPVVDITSTAAYIEADVIEGTYVIDDCYIAYKKHDATSFSTALITKDDIENGIHMEAALRNLTSDTLYDYKIYAITKTSKEVRVVEGSFKTASETSLAGIKGSVVYSDELVDTYEKYPVYVSLFEGNTYIAGCKLNDENETGYEFNRIADGTYRIVATDGLISKTKRVTVKNGGILEPEDYLSTNGIKFVLDGMSTEVVIEDNSINVAADGLDKIFESSSVYNGVISKDDKKVIAAGGSVNIALHAQYISEDEIPEEEKSEFDDNMSEEETIEKYISLYIEKTVRDIDGRLVEEPTRIPALYDGISITFPLGELQGQKVYVAMAHKEQAGGYTFKKWNTPSDVILTDKTVTINTNLFSTYALYTSKEAPKAYVVKWIDGDGKVLKTEIVEEGKSATPPEGTPTKTANSKQTFTFGGWDNAYDNITKDMIIAAWFTANEIGSTPVVKPDGNDNKPSGDSNHAPDATVKPGTSTTDKETPKYTYMGSSASPKTGDATPVMLLAILMAVSVCGVIIIGRRKCKNKN